MEDENIPILQTKLHRPRSAPDVIERSRLMELLDRGLDGPLTLVSAPAGYGKSTLVSQWTARLTDEWNCGWYSADHSDNDLRTFVLYVVGAVRRAVPGCCDETLGLLDLDTLPEPGDLALSFCNDLVDLEDRLLIVIDDFHRIHEPVVDDFLLAVLEHPPLNLHLAIVTRRDPVLSLNRWRVSGSINEVRLDELRFNEEEVRAYLGGALKKDALPELTQLALAQIEGWPVALRLLVMSLRGGGTMKEIVEALPSVRARVSEYMLEGLLGGLETDFLEALLKTSILNRFCADLCVAVVPDLDAPSFLESLSDSNLFIINLDESGTWFRYHHLFQEALQQQLTERHDEETVRETHRRAAEWLSEHEFVSDAVTHALIAGEETRAGEFVARGLRDPEVQTALFRRDSRMKLLPADVIRKSPALMVESTWMKLSPMASTPFLPISDPFNGALKRPTQKANS